jgi:hypothetical protein
MVTSMLLLVLTVKVAVVTFSHKLGSPHEIADP